MATSRPTGRSLTEHVTIEKPEMTIEGYVINNIETGESNLEEFVVFFGIPYAKPPIEKDERFLPPKPFVYDPAKHGKPFKAIKGSKMCAQLNQRGIMICDENDDPMDCLRLNVYVPKRLNEIEGPLAVMVYFHGGGFYQGSGNYDRRTPESMMRHGLDVIVVTVNYRLGPFGFLNLQTEKCRGNAGLKDQVEALKWVRDNIKHFKGNPGNVTIWGESAGGSCVNFHLISPLSKGLFHKAIIQSGGIYCPWGYTGDQGEIRKRYEKYGDILEVKHRMIVDKLIEADSEDILAFNEEILTLNKDFHDITIDMGPSIEKYSPEGAFLPHGVKELIEKADPVPILAGIASHEGYMAYEFSRPIFEYSYDWIMEDECFCRFLKAHLHWEEETIQKYFCEIRKKYFNVSEIEFELKSPEPQRKTDESQSKEDESPSKEDESPSKEDKSRSKEDESQSKDDESQSKEDESESKEDESESEEDESKDGAKKIEPPIVVRFKEYLAKICKDLWFYRFYDNIKLGDGSKPPEVTYIYEFDFISRLNPSHSFCRNIRGASHGDDMSYLLPSGCNRMVNTPFREDEIIKIGTMCSLWASFAKNSIPESAYKKVQPRWLPHLEEKPCYLSIGEDLKMRERRMNDSHWIYLKELNREDEALKAEKFILEEQNTVASFQTTLGHLNEVLRRVKSESALPGTANTSESSNLGASCSVDFDVMHTEGPSSSTLKVPAGEDFKRHSPSRSPSSKSKTSKDESTEAKRGRMCEEDQSKPHDSS